MNRFRGLLGNLLLAGVSALVGLYAIELTVRLIRPDDLEPTLDRLTRLSELRARGVEAYPQGPSELWSELAGFGDEALRPFGTVSSSRIVFCPNHRTGEIVEYDSDEHGFRNPPGAWEPPPEVVLIGDSYAQGYCVVDGADIAGRLRERGHRPLNLGQSATGPLVALATLIEYVRPLRPEFVFWLYYEGNDLRNLRAEQDLEFLRSYLSDPSMAAAGQGLIGRQAEVDSTLKAYFDRSIASERGSPPPEGPVADGEALPIVEFLKLWELRRRFGLTAIEPDPGASPADLAEVADAAGDLVAAWDGRLVFVYLPARPRYRFRGRGDLRFRRPAVLSAITASGLEVVDLTEAFGSVEEPARLFDSGTGNHYTPEGYRVVAEALDGWSRGAGLSPGGAAVARD